MIARFLGLLVRVLLETGVLLAVAAAMLIVFAFRTSRKLVVASPDPLDRLAGPAATLLAMAARAFPRENGVEEDG